MRIASKKERLQSIKETLEFIESCRKFAPNEDIAKFDITIHMLRMLLQQVSEIKVNTTKGIGKRLEWLLQHNDMTQGELAKRIGVSQSTISKYVHEDHSITAMNLIKISHVLNASPEWIMCGEEFE